MSLTVSDPGFPGAGANLLFGKLFAENCTKIKEIGPGSASPLDLPMVNAINVVNIINSFINVVNNVINVVNDVMYDICDCLLCKILSIFM